MITLQTLLDAIHLDALPFAWTTFDFVTFSPGRRLWNDQQTARHKARSFAWCKVNDVTSN